MRPIYAADAKVLAVHVDGFTAEDAAAFTAGWDTYGDTRAEMPAAYANDRTLELAYRSGVEAAKAQVARQMAASKAEK